MSRNLGQTTCYFCGAEVRVTGVVHDILPAEAGVYFDEYEGMVVADAECTDCKAEYLAWLDESRRSRFPRCLSHWPGRKERERIAPLDLSFRSTFDDEPGESDMPRYVIVTEKRRAPVTTPDEAGKVFERTSNIDAVSLWLVTFERRRGT
jgi:hypothetical protein